MICYICAEHATNKIKIGEHLSVTYCDNHRAEAAIGISDYALTGSLDKLTAFKEEYNTKHKGSAYNEFVKCKRIYEHFMNDDSSITEQNI